SNLPTPVTVPTYTSHSLHSVYGIALHGLPSSSCFPDVWMSIIIVRIRVYLCSVHSLSYSFVYCLAECDSCFVFRCGVEVDSLVLLKSSTLFCFFLRLKYQSPEFRTVLRACAPPWVLPLCKRICFLVICVSFNLWSVSCVPGCSICNKLCFSRITISVSVRSVTPSQSTLSLTLHLCFTPFSFLSVFPLFTLSLLSLFIAIFFFQLLSPSIPTFAFHELV